MRHDDHGTAEFDALFAELTRRSRPGRFEPNCDVAMKDGGDALVVTVEIAGADPTDLRVCVEDRYLLIAGRRADHDRSSRGSFLMKEIEYGDFVKKIRLPVAVEYENATAVYREGLLTIHLPIAELDAEPPHRIEIHMPVRRMPV